MTKKKPVRVYGDLIKQLCYFNRARRCPNRAEWLESEMMMAVYAVGSVCMVGDFASGGSNPLPPT